MIVFAWHFRLSKAHSFVLTEDHCKRFVDIFDIDRNGVSNSDAERIGQLTCFVRSWEGSSVQRFHVQALFSILFQISKIFLKP